MYVSTLLPVLSLLVCAGVSGQQLYQPSKNVSVYTWTHASSANFTYPELSDSEWGTPNVSSKPNFGIALSGGGYRATTLALGWVRALYLMGYLQQARYLSSNSGGSWFNGAFSFNQQTPTAEFLGPYVSPQNLTVDFLNNQAPSGKYGQVINKAKIVIQGAIQAAGEAITPGNAKISAWCNVIGSNFLEPFGLNSDSSSITAEGTNGNVAARLRQEYPDLQLYTATPDAVKPFPLMLGSILLVNTSQAFYPIEFTPLYIGTPPAYTNTTPALGDGFVEPIGFNSPPPANVSVPSNATNSPDNNNTIIPVTVKPLFVVPLKVMVGISSSFLTQGARPETDFRQDLTGTQILEYWNQINFTGGQLPFADGGGSDNSAMTLLLRRRVERIIVCFASNKPLDTNATAWGAYQWDVSGLFGAVPINDSQIRNGQINGVPVPLFNSVMQVFPTEGYQVLFDAIKAKFNAGQPAVYSANYTVMSNPYQAIHGGWKVQVLWVFNAQIKDWESALPQDTQATLNKSRTANPGVFQQAVNSVTGLFSSLTGNNQTNSVAQLKDYPYISTFETDYPPILVELLSQQATWQMLQLKPQLDQLVGSNVSSRAAAVAQQAAAQVQSQPPGAPGAGNGAAGQRITTATAMLQAVMVALMPMLIAEWMAA